MDIKRWTPETSDRITKCAVAETPFGALLIDRTGEKQLLWTIGPIDFLYWHDHNLEHRIGRRMDHSRQFRFFFRAERFPAADIDGDRIDGVLAEGAFVK